MNKKYYCLCETGKITVNECELKTLKEVEEFCNTLMNYQLELKDFESLIQVSKLEIRKYYRHSNEEQMENYRILILVKDMG